MLKAVLVNDTSYVAHHGCEAVVSNIMSLLKQRNIDIVATHPVGLKWETNKDFIEKMHGVDLVIINGEGTIHHQQQRAIDLVKIGKYVKENIKAIVVVINATYQDNGNEIADYMKYYDLIFVRETRSQRELSKYGINSKVVPDMTFYDAFDLKTKKISNNIGVTDSVFIELSEQLFHWSKTMKFQYLPIVTADKKRKQGSFCNLLRNVQLKTDYMLWKLRKNLDYPSFVPFYFVDSYKSYINKIANVKLLVTARYHSLCFSLKTLTPFVALSSNSHKIEGMLEDIGISQERMITIDRLSVEEINKVLVYSQDEFEKIRNYTSIAPSRIECMFDEIKGLLINRK